MATNWKAILDNAKKRGLKVSDSYQEQKKIVLPKVVILNVTPMGKPRMTQSDKWKKRPIVMKYRAFENEVVLQAKQQGYELTEVLNAKFVIPYPKSYLKKNGELRKRFAHLTEGTPHKLKPDVDNLVKAIMDSLSKDDRFVHTINCNKVWGKEGRIVIVN